MQRTRAFQNLLKPCTEVSFGQKNPTLRSKMDFATCSFTNGIFESTNMIPLLSRLLLYKNSRKIIFRINGFRFDFYKNILKQPKSEEKEQHQNKNISSKCKQKNSHTQTFAEQKSRKIKKRRKKLGILNKTGVIVGKKVFFMLKC